MKTPSRIDFVNMVNFSSEPRGFWSKQHMPAWSYGGLDGGWLTFTREGHAPVYVPLYNVRCAEGPRPVK